MLSLKERIRVSTLVAFVLINTSSNSVSAACYHPHGPVSLQLPGDVTPPVGVTLSDLVCLSLEVLAQAHQPPSDPPACFASPFRQAADLDCNGVTNVLDLLIAIGHYLNKKYPAAVDANADGCPDLCVKCGDPAEPACWAPPECVALGSTPAAQICVSCQETPLGVQLASADDGLQCGDGAICAGGVCFQVLGSPPSGLLAPAEVSLQEHFTCPPGWSCFVSLGCGGSPTVTKAGPEGTAHNVQIDHAGVCLAEVFASPPSTTESIFAGSLTFEVQVDPFAIAPTCNAHLQSNPSAVSGVFWIDPDGPGGVAPFEVWCDMDTLGGGWTQVARHEDNLAVVAVDTPSPGQFGVLSDDRWLALRATFQDGMMFRDEHDNVAMISKAKLLNGNCAVLATSLLPPPGPGLCHVWRDENVGCNGTDLDYSLICLHSGPVGSAIYSQSKVKFDIWPYPPPPDPNKHGDVSYMYQNQMNYYIR